MRFRRQIIDDLSFFPFDFSIKEFEKRFLMLFVYWSFLVWDSAFLKVKIVEPHFLSKRVISGLFLKAKTEAEEFAELNVQELGVWTEINEEQVGPKSTLFFWKQIFNLENFGNSSFGSAEIKEENLSAKTRKKFDYLVSN